LAVAEQARRLGDTATIRRLRPLKRAYDWAKATDGDGDGLMERQGGRRRDRDWRPAARLQSDGMPAVWVKALEAVPQFAGLAATARRDEARRLHVRLGVAAREAWLPAERRYAFALLEGVKLSTEVTVWPATGLAFGLFDEARGQQTSASLAGAGITTDWGARTLDPASSLFDLLHNNNGNVWPFVTDRRARPVPLSQRDDGLARPWRWPAPYSCGGWERIRKCSPARRSSHSTAVPQQFFATSMLVTPLVRGLVGWEGDAPNDRVTLAPHIPAMWGSLAIDRLPVGSGRYTVRFTRSDTSFVSDIERTAGTGVDTLVFEPALPLGAIVRDVQVNGRPATCGSRSTGADVHLACRLPLSDRLSIAVHHAPGWEVVLPPPRPEARSAPAA
jgi:hypothetical protein